MNIKERMEHYHIAGMSVSVITNAEIKGLEQYGVLEAGTANQANRQSLFNACSISKLLTSILIMVLNEKGMLNLDEDVNNNLSSWKIPLNDFTKERPVTLRSLLSHQSGIIDPENSFAELNSKDGIPSMADLLSGRTSYCKEPIEVKYEPGSEFHYSDAGYCIIQQLIEDVTGGSFEEIVKESIFQPLDMQNSTYTMEGSEEEVRSFSCGHNKYGAVINGKYPIYPYAAGAGFWTTPSDLSKLTIELMHSLKERSKLGLSVSKAEEMISPQGSQAYTGLGVFLEGSRRELEISSLGWGAGFQSLMVSYPYKGTGLIVMTNTDTGVHQMKGIIGEVYHAFAAGLE